MKRVLFYAENYCGSSAKGGTEVATYRIAKALNNTGNFELFNAFRNKFPKEKDEVYSEIVRLSRSESSFKRELTDFIEKYKIDIVINMSRFFRHNQIKKAVKESGREVKLMFMQHFAPGSEIKKATYNSGLHLLKLNPYNPIYWLRASIYPLLKLPRNLKIKEVYRQTYEDSDKVILLSEGYKQDYCKLGGFTDQSKFVSIPNIFEIQNSNLNNKISKEKRVLILSRMDEIQKRISLALRIWQKIELDPDLYEWQLDIVGSGHNTDIVRRLIKELKLERVNLHGWQPRESFLEKSEILMMTSAYEGLPLSVLEAQAYGCVPIAYNSFASLTDVVTSYEDGVVVDKFEDIDEFTKKLTELMYDSDYREELRKNAIEKAGIFSPDIIVKKWMEILI